MVSDTISVAQQAFDQMTVELAAAVQEAELEYEQAGGHGATLFSDQLRDSRRRTAGRDDVVDDQITPARFYRIGMHLDVVGSIFKVVLDADSGPRQLATLAHEVHR